MELGQWVNWTQCAIMKLPLNVVSGQETWSGECADQILNLQRQEAETWSVVILDLVHNFEVASGRGQWSEDVVNGW